MKHKVHTTKGCWPCRMPSLATRTLPTSGRSWECTYDLNSVLTYKIKTGLEYSGKFPLHLSTQFLSLFTYCSNYYLAALSNKKKSRIERWSAKRKFCNHHCVHLPLFPLVPCLLIKYILFCLCDHIIGYDYGWVYIFSKQLHDIP